MARNGQQGQASSRTVPFFAPAVGVGRAVGAAEDAAKVAATVSTVGTGIGLTWSLKRAAGLVLALWALAGCARVIGLGDDYYQVADEGGFGGVAGIGGTGMGASGDGLGAGAGAGGMAGGGAAGSAGAGDAPSCSDHPITAPSTWTATASSSFEMDLPIHLIDNAPARWSSGKLQSGDEWLQIDFGSTVSISTINLQQGTLNSGDYPRMYAVYISDVGSDFDGTACMSGLGTSGVTTTIKLGRVYAGRFLLIKQLGTAMKWWSIEELEVGCG